MDINASHKKVFVTFLVLFSFYLVLYLIATFQIGYSTLPVASNNLRNEENVRNKSMPKIMNILYWLDERNVPNDPSNLKMKGCKVTNCKFTTDASSVDAMEWDAIVINIRKEGLYEALGHKRNPKTYWIYSSREPPDNSPTLRPNSYYKDAEFNLSMTWRRDSDFLTPYFTFRKRNKPRKTSNLVNYAAEKSKKIAWIVSNCTPKSQRQKLAKSLGRYIQIDIFGECGTVKTCEKDCEIMIGQKYKFYLPFENELCVDYVTEKLLRPYRYNMIPVVYGLGYENLNLPPHSYIDVLDFPNVKELADYLKYLDKNDTAYNEYFMWTLTYEFKRSLMKKSRACEICEFLHKANDFNSDPNAKGNMKEKNIPVIPAKNRGVKVNMPKEEDSLQYIQINGSNIRILDFLKWFDAVCVNPNNDKNLYNFITGN